MRRRQAKLITFAAVAFSFLVHLSCPAHAQTSRQGTHANESSLQGLYNAALRFQKTGDLDRAAGQYREFLAAALDELANGRSWAGDYGKASSLFEEALALTPASPSIKLNYAGSAFQAGDLKRAEALTRGLLDQDAIDPRQQALAHQTLGLTLHKMNRDQEARKELEAAVTLDPNSTNQYDLAAVCLNIDEEKCAVQAFDWIEASTADTPALHMRIGLAYGHSDFASLAVTEFERVITEDPRYPEAHYCLAAALLEAGGDQKNVPEAEAELKTELTISPNDFLTYAALGKLAVTYNRYSEAEPYLKRATELNQTNPDAFLYLGQMYFDTNRQAEAESALRKAIELTKDPSRNRYQIQKAHFLLGRILMQEHRPDEAHAEMEIAKNFADKGLSHDKSELAGLLNNSAATGTGSTSDATETPAPIQLQSVSPEAQKDLSAVERQLTPAIADSYNNLGAIAATGKKYATAVGYFQRAAHWDPHLEGVDLNWGHAAFEASRFSDAIAPLSRYAKSHPEDAGIRGALAISQFMTQDYAGCVATFTEVEDRLASIPQMEYAFAESLVRTGEISAGKRRLETLESAHPEIPDVHRSLGEVYEAQRDRIRAMREFKTTILLDASDPEAHYDLGKIAVESGDTEAAISELEAAIRLAPGNPLFHRELASAYRLASRKDDASKELNTYESLKNSPTSAVKPTPAASETDAGR
jgi:tetratricopeptide (TPR) repeat protein